VSQGPFPYKLEFSLSWEGNQDMGPCRERADLRIKKAASASKK